MPAITSTFRSNEPSLSEVLRKIHEGVIQLPDFQPGWVLDEDHIRSLLARCTLSDCVSLEIDDDLQTVTKTFYPPFTKVDREEDYRRAWEEFSRRSGDAVSSDQLPVSSEESA